MKLNVLSVVSTLAAFATVATYWVLNFMRVDQGIKWPLLGVHMAIASIGLLAALWEMKTQWWVGLPCAIICGYFVYLQFLS
jgi:hypothetical protein